MTGLRFDTPANWPLPDTVESRSTATGFTLGEISLSSSSHFPLMPYSNEMKPVTLPPGRARLATKPAPTGSVTVAKTIGKVRSPPSTPPRSSADWPRRRPARKRVIRLRICECGRDQSPPPQRKPICTLRPTAQPNSCRLCRKAALRPVLPHRRGGDAEYADQPHPVGLLRPRHERPRAAAPPRSVMNSRRIIRSPRRRGRAASAVRSRPSALAVLRLMAKSIFVG